jgi:outer membrane protein TolC
VDVLTLGVYIRQLVYDGGRTRNAIRAARSLAQSVQAERDTALASLDLAVVRAFYEVVEADESVEALRAAIASYEESLRVAVLREGSGLLLRSERLNIEVQLSRTQAQLIAAQGRVDIARARFAAVLGLPAGSDFQPDSSAGLGGAQDFIPITASPTWPELAVMDARVQAAELALRSAKGARMPQVGAFASAQRDEGWRRDGSGESWTAGVAVSMNLYDGDRTQAAIREAGAALEMASETRRAVELALSLRLSQARVDYDVARRQLEVCRRQLEQADESARLSRERFAAGSLLSAELIGVETRLAEARVQLAVSKVRERVALAALRHALGINIL